jgi:hypothetical protein
MFLGPRHSASARALLVASGIATAAFWILAAAIGSFVGSKVALHPFWFLSQLLHVAGALLVIPAIPALLLVGQRSDSYLSWWAAVVAMIGSALFAADGLIALSVFPTLAENARELLEPLGAMNRGAMLATYIVVAAVHMVGWILIGAALWGGRAPTWTVGMLIAGAVLSNLPPGPVPLFVLALGGLLWSGAILWIAQLTSESSTQPYFRAAKQ